MKKVLSLALCLILILTSFTDSFAYASNRNSNTNYYDPESLLDQLPQTGTGTSIPDPYKAITPQLPSVPDVSNPQALAGPANNEVNPPMLQNDEECPVDMATGNLIQKNTDFSITGIGLNLSFDRNSLTRKQRKSC